MKAVLLTLTILVLVLSVSADDVGFSPVPVPSVPAIAKKETGIASWYGYPYHGRHAADGEIYDMEKLTAAHRTLPFGTWVRVVNLRNEKAVEVRITDRGPFIDGRIIDLSKAAARSVDMLTSGVDAVRLEVIGNLPIRTSFPKEPIGTPSKGADCFAVQVGAFRDRDNARRVLAQMQSRYGSGRIIAREGEPTLWRVLVGNEATQEGAIALAVRLRQESAQGTAFVARLDR